MTSKDLPAETAKSTEATIFNRLMISKASKRTREACADDLRGFADFLGIEAINGGHPLSTVPDALWADLDTSHVAAYLEHVKTVVSDHTGRPYSTATIARRMTAVRELLTEATYLGHSPVSDWNISRSD